MRRSVAALVVLASGATALGSCALPNDFVKADASIGGASASGGGASGSGGGASGSGGSASGSGAAAGGAGGSNATGGAGGGGGIVNDCGANGTHLVVDDFDDGAIDSIWFYDVGFVVETAGVLQVSLPANDLQFHGIETTAPFDLRNCSTHIELVTPPPVLDAGWTFQVGTNVDNRARFELEDGAILRFAITVGGALVHDDQVAFSATEHRWMRLQESNGTLYFHTASDGSQWTLRSSAPTPAFAASATIETGAGPNDASQSAFIFEVDNLNVAP
jgi:hypothetical protein